MVQRCHPPEGSRVGFEPCGPDLSFTHIDTRAHTYARTHALLYTLTRTQLGSLGCSECLPPGGRQRSPHAPRRSQPHPNPESWLRSHGGYNLNLKGPLWLLGPLFYGHGAELGPWRGMGLGSST